VAVDEIAIQTKLNGLLRRLSAKQVQFLEGRKSTKSDADACRLVGIASTTCSNWKRTNQEFYTAYLIITEFLPSREELIVADQSKQAIVRIQMAALLAYLPMAVQRHIDIITNSKSEEMSIRAMKLLYDTIGIGPQAELPISKSNEALMNVLKMVAPQAAKEADKRGLPVEEDLRDMISDGVSMTANVPDDIALEVGPLYHEDGDVADLDDLDEEEEEL